MWSDGEGDTVLDSGLMETLDAVAAATEEEEGVAGSVISSCFMIVVGAAAAGAVFEDFFFDFAMVAVVCGLVLSRWKREGRKLPCRLLGVKSNEG